MKLERYWANPVIAKNPQHDWEAGSVLNPCIISDEQSRKYHMVYRATNGDPKEFNISGRYISSIGYAETLDGKIFRRQTKPLIQADQPYESGLGCEDPRVTKVDGIYFLYYTAVGRRDSGKGHNIRIALAISTDFKNWEKKGIVGPSESSKAAVLFPEKVGDEYVMFYTLHPDNPQSAIMMAKFKNLNDVVHPPKEFMESNAADYENTVVFRPPENAYRGPEVGAPPIKTDKGWLLIYCNANTTDHPEWTISAALLDLNDPSKIIGHTKEPILQPETEAEKNGPVCPNTTFPQGAIVKDGTLYVYYGSGDNGCCLATGNFQELMDELT